MHWVADIMDLDGNNLYRILWYLEILINFIYCKLYYCIIIIFYPEEINYIYNWLFIFLYCFLIKIILGWNDGGQINIIYRFGILNIFIRYN